MIAIYFVSKCLLFQKKQSITFLNIHKRSETGPQRAIVRADSSSFGSKSLKKIFFLIESTFINQGNLDENPGFWLLLKNLKINNHWV